MPHPEGPFNFGPHTKAVAEAFAVGIGATATAHVVEHGSDDEIGVAVKPNADHDFQIRVSAELPDETVVQVIEETAAGASSGQAIRVKPLTTRTRIEVINNDGIAGHTYDVYLTKFSGD